MKTLAYGCLNALAFAAAALTVLEQPANAQTAKVIFRALDSTGKDTGTCLSKPASAGGWMLSQCDSASAAQKFNFSTAAGGPIQLASSNECVIALDWTIGRIISRQTCAATATAWRFSNGFLVGVQSPNQAGCLTANASLGTSMRVGDCTKPATLTKWSISPVQ